MPLLTAIAASLVGRRTPPLFFVQFLVSGNKQLQSVQKHSKVQVNITHNGEVAIRRAFRMTALM